MTSEQAVEFLNVVSPYVWTTNGSIVTSSDGTIISVIHGTNEWFVVFHGSDGVETLDGFDDLAKVVAWYVAMFYDDF